MQRIETKEFGLKETSRIKTFVFKFISVPAKWIKTARQYVLNIYTDNHAYAEPFKTDFRMMYITLWPVESAYCLKSLYGVRGWYAY